MHYVLPSLEYSAAVLDNSTKQDPNTHETLQTEAARIATVLNPFCILSKLIQRVWLGSIKYKVQRTKIGICV